MKKWFLAIFGGMGSTEVNPLPALRHWMSFGIPLTIMLTSKPLIINDVDLVDLYMRIRLCGLSPDQGSCQNTHSTTPILSHHTLILLKTAKNRKSPLPLVFKYEIFLNDHERI